MDSPGFNHLVAQCRKLRLTCQLPDPTGQLPDTERNLGAPLDPYLRVLLSRFNGGRLWDLYLYGGKGSPNELLTINKEMRLVSDDLPDLSDFLLFAQIGHQATHLAVMPALANSEGLQPVAYLDLNEGMKVLPLASNVDACFELLARYLEMLVVRSGDVEKGAMELLFPWHLPDLLASDEALMRLVNQGKFDRYTRISR